MEEPSHCRDLDGRKRERPVNPASQHLLQADLLALDWPSHQTSKGGVIVQARKSPVPVGHSLLWGPGDPPT